jgi:hypothetical protein
VCLGVCLNDLKVCLVFKKFIQTKKIGKRKLKAILMIQKAKKIVKMLFNLKVVFFKHNSK